jgi:hypothetical protein
MAKGKYQPIRHGHARNGTPSLIYNVWRSMRDRCANPRSQVYRHYGGRGITVDPRWQKFENFLADMGPKPPGVTLERIDNDGPYTAENCRWASSAEQHRNTRQNHRLTHQGQTLCVAEWATILMIHPNTLRWRLRRWSISQAMTMPVSLSHSRRSQKRK